MKRLWRWVKRLGLSLLALVLILVAPIGYTETMCRGAAVEGEYAAILAPEHHRPEARTLLTYPEWHIVHAYDDYARVIATSDPHAFGYLRAVGGFWSSLCALSEASAAHGGFDGATRQMVYVIGVSFSAEMALKALYEETLGRVAVLVRGQERSALDDLSSRQAADYAAFLQQTPWYRWDFARDAAALRAARTDAFRDRERGWALGLEYRAKAAYADVIAAAVAQAGADALRLRMIVTGLTPEALEGFPGVTVVSSRPEGLEIETPRYRELTGLLARMAASGADFVEIAGNDDILLTALSGSGPAEGALHSFARQGYGDTRHLLLVKVAVLAETLRTLPERSLRLEHVHDY